MIFTIEEQKTFPVMVQTMTSNGWVYFDNLEEAKKVFPTLDPNKNTHDFTWAMRDTHEGREYMCFEDWQVNDALSR